MHSTLPVLRAFRGAARASWKHARIGIDCRVEGMIWPLHGVDLYHQGEGVDRSGLRRVTAPARTEPMGIDELVRGQREAILRAATRHGARNVRVFGSVARGDADERSDVDFLVDLD